MIFSQSHKRVLNKSRRDAADSGSGVSPLHTLTSNQTNNGYKNTSFTHICQQEQQKTLFLFDASYSQIRV